MDVFTPLRAVLDRAWVLWELTMLAEPLMVVAPTPGHPLYPVPEHLETDREVSILPEDVGLYVCPIPRPGQIMQMS